MDLSDTKRPLSIIARYPTSADPLVSSWLIEAEFEGHFIQEEGPFRKYLRTPATDSTEPDRIEYEIWIPGLNWLFGPLYRRLLENPNSKLASLLPPAPISPASLVTLGLAFWITLVVAYCATLLGQTLAFGAGSLHASSFAQAVLLGASRFDVLIAIPVTRLADRLGRVVILKWSFVAAIVATVISGLSPNAFVLGVFQILAKAAATTVTLVVVVLVAESVETKARAWAMGFLILPTALGAGICAALVSTLGVTNWMWRVLFFISIFALALLWSVKRLAESERFQHANRSRSLRELNQPKLRSRLILISVAAALVNVFFIPASQFRNQYLTVNRHYLPYQVSLFTLFTNLPAGIGLALGSRLSETRGRRGVASLGLAVGGVLFGLAFVSSGYWLIIFGTLGSIAGTFGVPAISVFGPELFPTKLRSGANVIATVAGRIGSAVGLILVGVGRANGLSYGTPIALLMLGPVVLSVIVLIFFPETMGETLEEINPDDLGNDFPKGLI